MGFYESKILPHMLNKGMQQTPFPKERERLIPRAHGKVLEIGIGSGLNLPYYQGIESVTGVDPSHELGEMARQRAAQVDFPVEHRPISGEDLPLDNASFDCAVITWTLCTIPDPGTALREVRRVLKPDGDLLFVEHGLADAPSVQKWQHRVNRIWPKFTGGCNLNRKIDDLITSAGFRIDDIDTGHRPGALKIATYFYHGRAKPV